ncbi:unnamed protein product [Bemisia tabaci]|uniref:Uncharacterized protein n=1 Tax=Bemisia tabaci TaxID=7038 RepID=A0A9P0A588_BEMTA|nr:unnamed protein product [Bemisia tabaci]
MNSPMNETGDLPGANGGIQNMEGMNKVPDEEICTEMIAEDEYSSYENKDISVMNSTPHSFSFQRVMDESCSEMNNDWSPVMQRLKLLESQLESNDEVLHEMERSLKSKTPSNEVEEPIDEIDHLKKTISSLEQKVASAETTIYSLEEEIEEKNKLIEARTMVISVLQKDVEAKRVSTNSMFEKTQQEIQNMHENFMAFKENMAIENKKLLDQLDSSRQRYRKLDLKLKEAEKEKGSLVQLNNDLNFQIENIMSLNNQLKMKVVELTENIDSPKQKIRELTDELESVKQEFQKTVLNLELEIAHYKGECEKVKKSFQENQQLLEGEVAQLKEENNSMATKISNFESEIALLEDGKKQKEATLLALIEEKETLISDLKQTIEHSHSERDELLSRLSEAQTSLKANESNYEQILAEVVELRSALDAVRLNGSSEEVACSLNNEINVLQDQLCGSKNELEQEKHRVQMLTETIDELEEKIQDSDLLLLEEKQNTINIKKELDHLKQQLAEKEEELVREKGSAMQLQENFYHVLNELEQYKQHYSQNSSESLEIQQKLDSAEEEKARLETVISSLLRDVISMTAKSTETEINFEKENHLYVILQEKFTELSSTFLQTTTDLKQKEDIIANLEAEVKRLLKDKEEAISNLQTEQDNILQSKEDAIASLQKEIESLKQNDEERISLRDMEAYISQQDEMIKELRGKVQTEMEEANRLVATCKDLEQRLNSYAEYTSNEIANRDSMIQNLQMSLELKRGEQDPSMELQQLQARASYLEQTLMEVNSNLNERSMRLQEVESENEKLKAKVAEISVEELMELRKTLSENESRLAEKIKSLDELSGQHNELLAKFNEISNYVSAADAELINKDHAIRKLEGQIEDLQNSKEIQIEELQASLNDLKEGMFKVQAERDSAQSQYAEVQQTLQFKLELCDKLKMEVENLSAERDKLSSYESECAMFSRQLKDIEISKSQRHAEVEEELLQATNITQQLTDENNKLLNQVIQLSDDIKYNQVEKIALTDELSTLRKSLQSLKDENMALKDEAMLTSGLQEQITSLEQLINEKEQLISEMQCKLSASEECVREQIKPVEEVSPKNSIPGSFDSNEINGTLLPLAQEYLQINYELLILKDLLEDLIDSEIGKKCSDSNLKIVLENLESDLLSSEAVLKGFESKLRRSPGFSSDTLESSVASLKLYVDQITKQIATCGEVLKDLVLVKNPSTKTSFDVEVQTEEVMQPKLPSPLISENLENWDWEVEINDSEIKLDENSTSIQSYSPLHGELKSTKNEEANFTTNTYTNDGVLPAVNNLGLTEIPSSSHDATNLGVSHIHTMDSSEIEFQPSNWEDHEPLDRLTVMEEPGNSNTANSYNYYTHHDSHNHHDHSHYHNHSHEHRHESEHEHVHDHEHEHNDHFCGSQEHSHQSTKVSQETETTNKESEPAEGSQEDEEDEPYVGGYLQDNQLIVVNKASYEDMKVKLDSILYKLHEKDVQNNEFKRELIELLKERDILQLKLSSAYRLLANQEKETTDTNGSSNSIKNEELISKINELDSLSAWHDPRVTTENDQKNMQALYSSQALPANLRPQKETDLSEADSESAIYSLFNWITGSR